VGLPEGVAGGGALGDQGVRGLLPGRLVPVVEPPEELGDRVLDEEPQD
jgi:hypothetical protein